MTSNQANQASTSGTSTNTSTTTSAITKAATTSATVKPSSSALPTATPAPSASEKIATSIQFARDPNVVKGTAIGINVLASGNQICGHGQVTVFGAGGEAIGSVTSGGSSGCFYTALLETSSLNPGTYNVTLKFAGDSQYQPSQSTSTIIIR